MNNPQVSIIVATYNSGKSLRTALQSVIDQTLQDWECIVIDGASKDNTIEIVKEFEDKDSRFRHISEPDNGIYDAFNKGWKMAKGEWIYYLGSDDYLHKDGLNDLLIDNQGADIVFGDIEIIFENGRRKIQKGKFPCLRPIRLPGHQGIITRKDCIKKNEGFDENYKIIADKDLTISIFENGGVFRRVDTVVASFTLGATSSNISNISRMYKENLYFRKKHGFGFWFLKDISLSYSKRYLGLFAKKMKLI